MCLVVRKWPSLRRLVVVRSMDFTLYVLRIIGNNFPWVLKRVSKHRLSFIDPS